MTIYTCRNCEYETANEHDLDPYRDFWSRITAGDEMPAGDCPRCGSFAYVQPEPDVEAHNGSTPHNREPSFGWPPAPAKDHSHL